MQAKDVPDRPILEFLYRSELPGISYPGFPSSITNAMPEGTPEKVALAKMRSLVKRGLVTGCFCGCRGDFALDAKGQAFFEHPLYYGHYYAPTPPAKSPPTPTPPPNTPR